MKQVVIFGGTGFIGLGLANYLSTKNIDPILVARNQPKKDTGFRFVQWDAYSVGDWKNILEGAYAVVNLVGKSVDCIKSPDNCDIILRSRVDSTKAIGKALKQVPNPPSIWIQMSTAHIYGDPPKQICSENSSYGLGLAPFVAQRWEEALLSVLPTECREVRLRTSFVIGKGGGALKSLKKIVKLGLGGKVGNGEQGISWIHEFDMNNIIYSALVDNKYQGVYIVSSPNPVSNKAFMKTLRKTMRIPIGLSAPELILRFGAKYIFKTDPDLALYGRYLTPQNLINQNYKFKFPTLKEALEDLIS